MPTRPPDWRKLPEHLTSHPAFIHYRIDQVEQRQDRLHEKHEKIKSAVEWVITFLGFAASLYPGAFHRFVGF